MAEDLTKGVLAASRVAEKNHEYLVAKVRFNELFEGMSSVSKGINVCYIQDSEHILGSSLNCRVPLQTLLNDGWRIQREYTDLLRGDSKDEDIALPGALYIFVRDAPAPRA